MWDRLILRPDPPPNTGQSTAAVLAALYDDRAGDVRVILTKRPDTMPTHAGHIAFPGGRPHPGDDGPAATALREAHEEVGLDPEKVEVIGYLEPIHTVEFALLVVPVVGRLDAEPELAPSEREVAMVLQPRLSDLAEPDRWRFEMWRGNQVWFYDLEGEVLWGATARMVRRLVGLGD
ncbi:MAG TPA: CoA pyrophosphatase [Acidimicrobiia bacterium]|jgi:8-oxo-dGTP pyrophosphatase MutT (NUDIX family)